MWWPWLGTIKALIMLFLAFFLVAGCYNQRFNVAVKDVLGESQAFIDKVHRLMRKLVYSTPAALLRQSSHLKKVQRNNVTRWSLAYSVLLRYKRIKKHAPIDRAEVKELLISEENEDILEYLLLRLVALDLVAMEI